MEDVYRLRPPVELEEKKKERKKGTSLDLELCVS